MGCENTSGKAEDDHFWAVVCGHVRAAEIIIAHDDARNQSGRHSRGTVSNEKRGTLQQNAEKAVSGLRYAKKTSAEPHGKERDKSQRKAEEDRC